MARVSKFSRGRYSALAITNIHKQPFPFSHYCSLGQLPREVSDAPTNDLSSGVILQHPNTTPYSACRTLLAHPPTLHIWTGGQVAGTVSHARPELISRWLSPVDYQHRSPVTWRRSFQQTGFFKILVSILPDVKCHKPSPSLTAIMFKTLYDFPLPLHSTCKA